MGIFSFFNKKNNESKSAVDGNLDTEPKAEVIEFIEFEVRFGFTKPPEILKSVWAAGFENEDGINLPWLKKRINEKYEAQQARRSGFKSPTDFTKLAAAFDQLSADRIITLHNAGYTKQDGYGDVLEAATLLKKSKITPIGFCFYHQQDLERVINPDGQRLYLAFDSMDQNDEAATTIGHTIVEALHNHGLNTEWDGTIKERIAITNFCWEKVPDNEVWDMRRSIGIMKGNG